MNREQKKRLEGFTVVELVVTGAILSLLIAVATLSWWATTRRVDLRAAAQIMMEDIRKVYSFADASYSSTDAELHQADRYRILINFSTDSPPSAYRIQRRVHRGGLGWDDWRDMKPELPLHTVVTVGAVRWIKPTASADFQIVSLTYGNGNPVYTSGEKFIAFVRSGTITRTAVKDTFDEVNPDPLIIRVRSASQGTERSIRISRLGKVWME